MTGEVVPLHRCYHCKASGKPRELYLQGQKVSGFVACDDCVARTDATLTKVRPIFDVMIAAGVPRETANDVMTFLLESWQP